MEDGLSNMFYGVEFAGPGDSQEDLFSMLDTFEEASKDMVPFSPFGDIALSPRGNKESTARLVSQRSISSLVRPREDNEVEGDEDDEAAQNPKKLKFAATVDVTDGLEEGQQKISHITVERNRRKQMNEHLTVLRTLMPSFYVKRGDQASIIGGVVDYIKELQQVLKSLEAKKQRKVYSDVLSPRPASSPRPVSSPRPSPLSPRKVLPISPRTPQPGSPYNMPRIQQSYISPTISSYEIELSPSIDNNAGEVAANSKSPVADVEVKFSGPNILVKTVSHRIPGQALKIISALEGLPLEILHVNISTIDDSMLNSFTIKIGIECKLSAEELAQEIQNTFSQNYASNLQQQS